MSEPEPPSHAQVIAERLQALWPELKVRSGSDRDPVVLGGPDYKFWIEIACHCPEPLITFATSNSRGVSEQKAAEIIGILMRKDG